MSAPDLPPPLLARSRAVVPSQPPGSSAERLRELPAPLLPGESDEQEMEDHERFLPPADAEEEGGQELNDSSTSVKVKGKGRGRFAARGFIA